MDTRTWTDEELVAFAHEHCYEVTARQLERWHKADALPRAIQDAHVPKGTRSFYPPGTDAYLLAACRLRAEGKGRPLWRLRFELWWEGFSIPPAKVRTSLVLLLRPIQALVGDEGEMERALDEVSQLEQEQTRRGLAAHTRMALQGHPNEAVDLMTLILGLLAGQQREINEPIERAVSPRTFADALTDVLTYDGTRTPAVEEAIEWNTGAPEALREATRVGRSDPGSLLAGISDERLLAARDAARALHTALPVVAEAHRRLTGKDLAGLRLVRQAFPVAEDPAARAEAVLLFASAPAFSAAMLTEAAAMFTTTERRYAAMNRVLEAIPESRILDGGDEALASLPLGEREALKDRVKAFLEAHPRIAAVLEEE